MDLSILLTFIFQDLLATALLNFDAPVIHQTKYQQQQYISETSPMALPIYSPQKHEMHQKGKHLSYRESNFWMDQRKRQSIGICKK